MNKLAYISWSGGKLHIVQDSGRIFCGRKVPWERVQYHETFDLPVCNHCDRWAAYYLGAEYNPALELIDRRARGHRATRAITQRARRRQRVLRQLSEPRSRRRLVSALMDRPSRILDSEARRG